MAIRVEKNDDIVNGNGWTRYQQLVLNELERHEEKLDILEKEIISLRLANARIEMEIKINTDALNKLLAKIETLETSLITKTNTLNQEREKMSSDLSLLKWKVGAAATLAATVFSGILQGVIKYFLHM